ncbi:MAG: rRNA (guanine-N-2-) -methyltransferase rlmL [Polyangiaceae bacterium]|jgi:putative N6-adenine-specific DNA methylase|nr:rRNA (guanine-N-2-) -methyltransferase rlmL [Polyangiaceae bacterium]
MTEQERRPTARFFATAAKGTEPLLRDELHELGLRRVRADRGGVHFGAELSDAYRACLWSRIALRVLEPLVEFACPHEDALYEGVKGVDWTRVLDARRTLAVRAACRSSRLTHTQYIAQRTKDAVVDQLRERLGARPSVDRQDPDVQLFVHLVKDRATIYLDHSGDSLHAHGFRAAQGAAPIKETLASALVRYSGWDRESPLVDPMCGSGTLLLEAGLWAARRAPGLARSDFGFERWADFDDQARATITRLREEARDAAKPLSLSLIGSDTDAGALEAARANAEQAGLRVNLRLAPVTSAAPSADGGGLVVNPPYGERLRRDENLGADLAKVLQRFEAYERALIVPRQFDLPLRADKFLMVFNGAIECELRRYEARRVTP